jgi:hypothetical protein
MKVGFYVRYERPQPPSNALTDRGHARRLTRAHLILPQIFTAFTLCTATANAAQLDFEDDSGTCARRETGRWLRVRRAAAHSPQLPTAHASPFLLFSQQQHAPASLWRHSVKLHAYNTAFRINHLYTCMFMYYA